LSVSLQFTEKYQQIYSSLLV